MLRIFSIKNLGGSYFLDSKIFSLLLTFYIGGNSLLLPIFTGAVFSKWRNLMLGKINQVQSIEKNVTEESNCRLLSIILISAIDNTQKQFSVNRQPYNP